MTFDYARSQATADRLLAKFGQSATLTRETRSGVSYDPTVTTADHVCTVVVLAYRNAEIDGTRIQATDKKVLMAKGALAIEPTTEDKLVVGGISHSIVSVEPLAPGGVVVMWTVQIRR